MAEDDKQDLHDILIEETTRGQKHSKKALSFARQRMIRRVGRLLADPNCATRQLFWKLLGRSGCQTNLLSFGRFVWQPERPNSFQKSCLVAQLEIGRAHV